MPKCKHPIYIHDAGGAVGCGQCTPCSISKRRAKTARLLQESLHCPDVLFVTLTYKDKFLPIQGPCCDVVTGEEYSPMPTLRKSDLQNFNKRLRRRLAPRKIRIAYAGEYGEKNSRPHFHLVIFGATLRDSKFIFESWCDPKSGEMMCDPAFLDIQVPRNEQHVSQYVLGYVVKKMVTHDRDDLKCRPKEFARLPNHCGSAFVDAFVASVPKMRDYIALHGDIPRSFRYAGKDWPIPREFRSKILEALPDGEQIKASAFKSYKEKVQPLFETARLRARCPATPFETWTRQEVIRFRQWFADLAAAENAPSVAVIEARHKLSTIGKVL